MPIVERKPDAETKLIKFWLARPSLPDRPEPNTRVMPRTVERAAYGDILIAIYGEWVRKDVGISIVMNFERALRAWVGEQRARAVLPPRRLEGVLAPHPQVPARDGDAAGERPAGVAGDAGGGPAAGRQWRASRSMIHRVREHRIAASLLAGAALALATEARASREFWPELSAFIGMTPQTRLYLDASYALDKESPARTLDLSAFVDISLRPLRESRRTEDWQRARMLWARVGYTRVFKANEGAPSIAEDRLSAALYAKALLPAEVLLEARLRSDLRWIGGDFSTRQRLRLELNREFAVQQHAVVPYFQIEGFYDARYDGWSRTLYQPGVEIELTPHFRLELYLARQQERLPKPDRTDALGVVAKWYY